MLFAIDLIVQTIVEKKKDLLKAWLAVDAELKRLAKEEEEKRIAASVPQDEEGDYSIGVVFYDYGTVVSGAYSIRVNGESASKANANDTVTLTVTSPVTQTSDSIENITLDGTVLYDHYVGPGNYEYLGTVSVTFTMPARDVTVSVELCGSP